MRRIGFREWIILIVVSSVISFGCSRDETRPTADRAPAKSAEQASEPSKSTASQPAAGAHENQPGLLPVERQVAATPIGESRAPSAASHAPSAAPSVDGHLTADTAGGIRANPLRKNGDAGESLFSGWPTPKAVLVFSGQQDGYLEPCGCAGLENQKGGLSRRHTFLKTLTAKGWNVVPMDVGGLIRRYGRQAELQLQTTVNSMQEMGYRAIGLGTNDLRLPSEVLTVALAGLQKSKTTFTSANVALQEVGENMLPRFAVVDAGGMKIGVVAVLGDRFRRQLATEGIKTTEAEAALGEVLPKLKEKKCDLLVLLSHATPDESKQLAAKYPDFPLVVTAGRRGEPALDFESVAGTQARFVELGEKAEFVVAVGLFDDAQRPMRYERVPLDARYKESPEMKRLKAELQEQLKDLGLEGLGITPAALASEQRFVGTKTCAECHTKAAAAFERTPHAHATKTLMDLDPPRHFDPECLSCHVTGWEPQKFVPLKSGFESLEKTPLLVDNGCENCHGPGDKHAAAEAGDIALTDQQKSKLREEMRLPYSKAADKCAECHDLDNDPKFFHLGKEEGLKQYWPKIEHKGKD